MKRIEFIRVYKQLTPEHKEKLDELIQRQSDTEAKIGDLLDKFNSLPPDKLDELERDQNEYLEGVDEEEREIQDATYATNDPEEAFSLREMDLGNLKDQRYDVLTTSFPIGMDILKNEVDQLENQIFQLLP